MKSVTIGGVDYLPASQLAKQFKYTSDYIGQLCRAKKIDAQLVGRSWYVNPESLTEHKNNRYNKPEVKSEANESGVKISRVEVTSPVTKNIVKMSAEATESNFAKRIDWKPLKYELDEGDLLPQVNHTPQPTKVKIDLAESTDIAIKLTSKSTKLVAEPMPEVSLKGRLKVASLDDESISDQDSSEVMDIPLPPIPKASPRKEVGALHHSLPKKARPTSMSTIKNASKSEKVKNKMFVPVSVREVEEETVSIEYVRVTLLTTTGVLLVCLFLLFFSESYVAATPGSYQWGIDFSTQSLSALVSLFSY